MAASTAIAWPSALLRIGDLTCVALEDLLDLATRMAAEPDGWRDAHSGETVVAVYEWPDERPRISFDDAAQRLGILPIALRLDELEHVRGGAREPGLRVVAAYASALVLGIGDESRLRALAGAVSVPVLNARSCAHHPCQAVADLLTLREHFGTLDGLKIAYVGDAAPVTHSLMEAGALCGLDVRVACPPGHGPATAVRDEARLLAELHDGGVTVTDDPVEAVSGVHAVYTAPTPNGPSDPAFRVDAHLTAHVERHTVFMHPLPAVPGAEVTRDVLEGSRSLVAQQAANRVPAEEAILHTLIAGAHHHHEGS